jgi:Domain of unknown function (DUF4440)/Aspartyl protease
LGQGWPPHVTRDDGGASNGQTSFRVPIMWTRHFASGFAFLAVTCFAVTCLLTAPRVSAQSAPAPPATTQSATNTPSAATPSDEIPIEKCDLLPIVKVRAGSKEMRFLVDTAATSMLNLKSFRGGGTKEIRVTSWSGTAATSAREVTIDEFSLGSHRLRNLKLPAIDLSPIGNACGGQVDGILGVDLLDKMAATIDLKRRIASLGVEAQDPKAVYADMEGTMHGCMTAFEAGKAAEFGECLDPEVVFYTPFGEFVGRERVLQYLRDRYFRYAPDLHHRMKVHEMQVIGNALWYSYEYTIDTPKEHLNGHGFAMCRRIGTQWRMLNLHNSLLEASAKVDSKP